MSICLAYQLYEAKFAGPEWDRPRDLGAAPAAAVGQHRPKDPSYSDVFSSRN